MGKFDGVMLASDYDDTLYSEEWGIARESRAAMEYFISEGGFFVISTGRSLENFEIQIHRERLPINSPAILSNGATVYDFQTRRTLFASKIRAEIIGDMAHICRIFPDIAFEAYRGETVYVFRPNRVTHYHLARAGLQGVERPIEDMPAPWTKAIIQHEDEALLLRVQAYIQDTFPTIYEAIFSNSTLLEITAKGSHKGSAILWLADYLGVGREHIYAVGNGENDYPMMAAAARAFAPENCADCLRQWGATILPNCEDGCVGSLVEWLDKQY